MITKIVISFLIVAITFIASATLQSNNEDYNNKPSNVSNWRLPNNTAPLYYTLRLNTWIHRGEFSFNGEVTILISVQETSRTITLHARQILILQLNILNQDGSIFDSNIRFTYDSETEFLTLMLNRDMTIGTLLYVDIWYVGFLAQFNDRGFFRTSYIDAATNETHWFATTHFQPIHARQAFPCYDEIRYRTPYDLQIFHHQSYNAISNMAVERVELHEEYVTTVFETSPPMPTFQLSFTVSNFNYSLGSDTSVEMRVYARPNAIALGQAENAVELGYLFLRAMEDYFGFPYVLTKSYQIALPELASNGANNWGMLSFLESILLQTNDDPAEQHFREIRIGHEYAHNVYANLISPASWSYLWLNEGFATLYENVLNDIIFPEKRQWERFLIDYFDVAIATDVYDEMPPMNQYAESPDEIHGKFNFANYNKAAIVLRMFHEAFSEDTWRKGLLYYIRAKAFDSATPEDLYAAMQIAYDEDYPERNDSVDALMRPWFDYNGFPVVTINRTEQGLIVSQQGFQTSHTYTFSVPINYATDSNRDFENTTAEFWLMGEEMFIPRDTASKSWDDDDWIIFNLRDAYYYVTNYDDTLWDLIMEAMMNDHENIHFLNRGTLFADLERFLTNNYDIRVTLYLQLIESLPFEFHPHVWSRANAGLLKIERRLRGSELHSAYLSFLQDVMGDIYGETRLEDLDATNVINRWSCVSRDENCLRDSLNILLEVMDAGSTLVDIDFRCNAFLTANETVWMYFYNDCIQQNPSNSRVEELTSLLCTYNEDRIRFLLDSAVQPLNNLEVAERNAIILAACTQSEISYNTAIQFVEDRYQTILAESLDLVDFISALSTVSNSDSQAQQVLNLHRHIPPNWNIDIENFRQIIEPNRQFYIRNSEEVRGWLETRNTVKASV